MTHHACQWRDHHLSTTCTSNTFSLLLLGIPKQIESRLINSGVCNSHVKRNLSASFIKRTWIVYWLIYINLKLDPIYFRLALIWFRLVKSHLGCIDFEWSYLHRFREAVGCNVNVMCLNHWIDPCGTKRS